MTAQERTRELRKVASAQNWRFIAMIYCLVIAWPTQALADGVPEGAKAAVSVSSTISYVATGGIWEHEGRFGRYRLVVVTMGVEHAGTYVYGQWLSINEETHELVEVATVPIDSLNKRFASVVQNVRFDYARSRSGKGVFDLIMSDRLRAGETRATVTLGNPGDVSVDAE